MSFSDRRRALAALAATVATAGCGFRPVYGSGSGRAFERRIRVAEPPGRRGYFYARALRRRLGEAGPDATLTLETRLSFAERATAITVEDDVTRFDILGAAAWRLSERGDAAAIAEGEAEAATAYNTLARPYATRTAERDAERRLAEELAARVFLELAAALGRLQAA